MMFDLLHRLAEDARKVGLTGPLLLLAGLIGLMWFQSVTIVPDVDQIALSVERMARAAEAACQPPARSPFLPYE